jgi:DNA-binding transcriptional LysR family regulator
MDRLDELEVFVAVIEAGSLVAASRRLHQSPPAITRALKSLEGRFGQRLIERSTRRLALTDLGKDLAQSARALLSGYEDLLGGGGTREVSGLLRITAPVQFGRRHIAPIVSAFLNQHPRVQVELHLNDRNVDLIEQGLDLAVRIGVLADSTLVARQVGSVKRVLVASPEYLARRGIPRVPADLAKHDTIFGMARSATTEWHFGAGAQSRSRRATTVRLAPRLLVDDVETRLQAAQAGRGIARALSYQVVDAIAAGTLVRLLVDYEPQPVPIQLVILSRSHLALKVRAFLDAAVAALTPKFAPRAD